MSFKPSDFFLGVVSFLGVLLPGAVFIFLLAPSALMQSKLPPRVWIALTIASYLIGHVLLAVSEMLNPTVDRVSRFLSPKFFIELGRIEFHYRKAHNVFMSSEYVETDAAKNERTLKARGFCFHMALSCVRLRNAEAAAEVDHHMADYKLLRSLVLVLLLSAAFMYWFQPAHRWLSALEIVISLLPYLCFVRMYNWARYLAFSYAQLLIVPPQSSPAASPQKEIVAGAEKIS